MVAAVRRRSRRRPVTVPALVLPATVAAHRTPSRPVVALRRIRPPVRGAGTPEARALSARVEGPPEVSGPSTPAAATPEARAPSVRGAATPEARAPSAREAATPEARAPSVPARPVNLRPPVRRRPVDRARPAGLPVGADHRSPRDRRGPPRASGARPRRARRMAAPHLPVPPGLPPRRPVLRSATAGRTRRRPMRHRSRPRVRRGAGRTRHRPRPGRLSPRPLRVVGVLLPARPLPVRPRPSLRRPGSHRSKVFRPVPVPVGRPPGHPGRVARRRRSTRSPVPDARSPLAARATRTTGRTWRKRTPVLPTPGCTT